MSSNAAPMEVDSVICAICQHVVTPHQIAHPCSHQDPAVCFEAKCTEAYFPPCELVMHACHGSCYSSYQQGLIERGAPESCPTCRRTAPDSPAPAAAAIAASAAAAVPIAAASAFAPPLRRGSPDVPSAVPSPATSNRPSASSSSSPLGLARLNLYADEEMRQAPASLPPVAPVSAFNGNGRRRARGGGFLRSHQPAGRPRLDGIPPGEADLTEAQRRELNRRRAALVAMERRIKYNGRNGMRHPDSIRAELHSMATKSAHLQLELPKAELYHRLVPEIEAEKLALDILRKEYINAAKAEQRAASRDHRESYTENVVRARDVLLETRINKRNDMWNLRLQQAGAYATFDGLAGEDEDQE